MPLTVAPSSTRRVPRPNEPIRCDELVGSHVVPAPVKTSVPLPFIFSPRMADSLMRSAPPWTVSCAVPLMPTWMPPSTSTAPPPSTGSAGDASISTSPLGGAMPPTQLSTSNQSLDSDPSQTACAIADVGKPPVATARTRADTPAARAERDVILVRPALEPVVTRCIDLPLPFPKTAAGTARSHARP
jgi:hypothetical protein